MLLIDIYKMALDHISCVDINECDTGTVCGANGLCEDTVGSVECFCSNGLYTKCPLSLLTDVHYLN